MRRLLLGGVLFLSACGAKSPSNDANLKGNQAEPATAATASAANESEANSGEASSPPESGNALGTLPPEETALRFVGTWATSQANCALKAWRFTDDEITATDGPHCSIYKVSKVPGGYDLAAQCPSKKPVPTDLIKVRFAESARAMLVESNAISPMGLVYCGK